MSLTKTSRAFRRGIKIVGAFAVVYYIAILIVIPNTKEFFLNLFVDRNPPNPKYGPMDQLTFEPVLFNTQVTPEIELATKDGRLPAGLPRKMPVYRVKPPQYSYLAGKNAQEDADKLGFKQEELISDLKGREYQWRSLNSGGYLTINTETRSITLLTDLYGRNDQFQSGTITVETAKSYAINLLKDLNRYNEKLYRREDMKVFLGQIIGSTMVETKVNSEAQFALVYLYGKVGEYPIMPPNAIKGLIGMVLRNPNNNVSPFNNPLMEGHFWDIEQQEDASYPIITVNDAWKQVVAGKGVITSAVNKNENPFNIRDNLTLSNILVNKIYLAYYMTPQYQKYMQPIYVFEGNFVTQGTEGGAVFIYYPAITAVHTKGGTPNPTAAESQ